MPNENEGAPIGRVGDEIFRIRNGCVTPTGLTGKLAICINDDLGGIYDDNEGFVNVEITLV